MWSSYPWQTTQWEQLLSAYRQARLPQGLLFRGPEGLGKFDCAHAFSARVLCEGDPAMKTACGVCRSCTLFKVGSHPDFFCIEPEEKSKSIKVDQLRNLIHRLGQTPQRGVCQVVILHPADAMNRSAANALLKTLEEPSGNVLIILVSERVHTLPPTVVSRCQSLMFSPTQSVAAQDWLCEHLEADQDPALLLRLSEQAPLSAVHRITGDYLALRKEVFNHCIQMLREDVSPIAPVSAWLKKPLEDLLHLLMTITMDIMRLQLGASTDVLFHADCLSALNQLLQKGTPLFYQQFYRDCQEAQAALKSGVHVNPQLLLEYLLIELYRRRYRSC